MEALRDILRWWQSLSAAANVICTIALVAVIGALGAGMYYAYRPPPAQRLTAAPGNQRIAAEPSHTNILSLPLPGTQQRKEVEIAQRLESALSRYDYIAWARADFAIPLTRAASPESPRLTLQLQVDPTRTPPDDWVNNLVTFVRHTVPEVEPANLLITDSSGTVLFSEGHLVRPAQRPAAGPLPARRSSSALPLSGRWLTASALTAICVLLTLAVFWALQRGATRRRTVLARPTEAAPAPTDQPLVFLSELTAPNIAALLRGERPQVAGLVLAHVADQEAACQVRQTLHLAADAPAEATRSPRHETLLALAEALQVKAIAGQDGPGGQPTVPLLHADSQGD